MRLYTTNPVKYSRLQDCVSEKLAQPEGTSVAAAPTGRNRGPKVLRALRRPNRSYIAGHPRTAAMRRELPATAERVGAPGCADLSDGGVLLKRGD